MVQHVKPRLGLLSGLAVAVLLACSPASAKAPPADGGTAPTKDAGTSAKTDDTTAKRSGGGGSCTGKATFCGVYGQTFCSSQPGCSYSFATNTCNGLPMKCETATNEAFCKKIKGCKWK